MIVVIIGIVVVVVEIMVLGVAVGGACNNSVFELNSFGTCLDRSPTTTNQSHNKTIFEEKTRTRR